MKCVFCLAPMPHKGLVCGYCGQRNPLNLNAISKIEIEEKSSEHNCPACNVLMENINIGTKTKALISRCSECDGVFIFEDILEQLLKSKSFAKEDFDPLLLRFVQDNPRQKKENIVLYRRCPVCNEIMQRINYKAISGVIVDRCIRHGVWLDGGELKQLFEWKNAGGETKLARLAAEKKPTPRKRSEPVLPSHQEEVFFDPIGTLFNWLHSV